MTTRDPAFVGDATVELDQVSKWFGQKVAVSDVSCSFGPGLTGLLGPNGAGKTTMLRLLTGLLTPSKGTIRVLKEDPRTTPAVFGQVGLVPEEDATYGFLSGREFVTYSARLSGKANPRLDAERALGEVGLLDDADRDVAGYSKGMKQRVKVAAALVHEPLVLVLDEPLNGTDPVQRAHLISLFRHLADTGHTVIVSSHVLAEVEKMTDRILAIVDGKLAAAGDIGAIRAAMADIPYRLKISTNDSRALAARLIQEPTVESIAVQDESIHLATRNLDDMGRAIATITRDLGVALTGYEPEDESLESVFRYLVERR
ncbi:MAG: ABC transporter ATP-binding protein [Acidimicrobiia bacterium]|nr:ABC transporter ATP-binding protein [Acidimicrobiia bacterium]